LANEILSILKYLEEGFIAFGPEGTPISANPAAYRLLGVPDDSNFDILCAIKCEPGGRSLTDTALAAISSRADWTGHLASTDDKLVSASIRLPDKGSGFHAYAVLSPGCIASGKNVEITLACDLLDSIPNAILAVDEQLAVIYCNAAYCRLFAISFSDIQGKRIGEVFPAFAKTQSYKAFSRVLKTGQSEEVIGAFLGGCYRSRIFRTPQGILAIAEDVTDAHRAHTAVEESESHYRSLVDNYPNGVVALFDRDTRFISAGGRGFERLPYGPQDLIGKTLRETGDSELERGLAPHFEKALRGETSNFEFARRGLTHQCSTIPIKGEDGEIHYGMLITREITELKKALTELEAARDAAESSNRAKSAFLANMSHEIRTPLNGMMGMMEILGGTRLSVEQREYLDAVMRSSEALLTVISDILDISKIEAGKVTVEPICVNLLDLVEEVTQLMCAAADKRGLELILRYAPTAPVAVIADPMRLRQVLTNLIGNAIKFTDKGYVFVDLDSVEKDPDTHVFSIHISDTGIGIPADKIETIFDMFTQADPSISRRFGGSGLGLAISQRLTRLMGGTLSVKSRAGKGSTFTLELPLALDRSHKAVEPKQLAGAQVLVVDSVGLHRKVFIELLESWNAGCIAAADLDEAAILMKHANNSGEPFSLVLMDDYPGDEEMSRLKSICSTSEKDFKCPIVLLSSMSARGRAESSREAAHILIKPVRRALLYETVLSFIEGRGGSASKRMRAAESSKPPSGRGTARMKRVSVLLAEDNKINQKLFTTFLSRSGCSVEIAENGRVAVEKLASGSYDIVFMDMQMPEMNGLDATMEIRKAEAGKKRTPIVALTAGLITDDRDQCLKAGMDDFVPKPVSLSAMREMIQKHVLGRKNKE